MGCVVLYRAVGESEWRLTGVRVVAVWLGGLSAYIWLVRRLGRLAEYAFGDSILDCTILRFATDWLLIMYHDGWCIH